MAVAHDVKALFDQLSYGKLASSVRPPAPLLLPHWPELQAVLPDGGLPRGVIELVAPRALGGATSLALAAVRGGQARNEQAWCAWVDPDGSLHAPGVVASGVDLSRLLVIRPPRARARSPEKMGRVAVKVVGSGAFEVVVVDVDVVGAAHPTFELLKMDLLVRKLALAAEPSGTTVILLTDSLRPRAAPLPVALRLELSRPDPASLRVRLTKEKRGRAGPDNLAKTVPFAPASVLFAGA